MDDSIPGQLEEIRQRLVTREWHVDARFDDGERRMKAIEALVAENTLITRQVAGTVETIHEMVEAGKAMKLVGAGATKLIKWVGAIALAISAVWALVYQATHGGKLPGS